MPMLKLSSFPRGTNRNRPLKLKAIAQEQLAEAENDSPQETRRLFQRFWNDYRRDRRRGHQEDGG